MKQSVLGNPFLGSVDNVVLSIRSLDSGRPQSSDIRSSESLPSDTSVSLSLSEENGERLTSVIAKQIHFRPARTSGMISFLRASDPKFMTGGS